MATPTPGTIPALPQYQPGALPLAGTEAFEIVNTTNAQSAASYFLLVSDAVGKVASILPSAPPASQDLVTVFQKSSGLPYSLPVGSFGTITGNVPAGGLTGQLLAKNTSVSYDDGWFNITTFVASGTGLALSGSTTIVLSVATGGIGSTQIGTNAVGNAQFRQGAPLSVVGVSANATANVADIVSGAGSSFLQSNGANTGVLFGPITVAALPGPYQTGTLTPFGVVYGAGTSALAATASGTALLVLMGNGTTNAPSFQLVNLTGSVVGILPVSHGGTNTASFTAFGAVYANNTSSLAASAAGTALLPLLSNGTTSAPSFQPINLTASVTGTLAIPQGGTNATAFAAFGVVYANNTSALAAGAAGTTGFVLVGQGSAAAPIFAGGMVLLNTITPTNITTAIDTTSLTAAYSRYRITFDNVCPSIAASTLQMQVATSGTTMLGAFYISMAQINVNTTIVTDTSTAVLLLSGTRATTQLGTSTFNGLFGSIEFQNPSSTVVRKNIRGEVTYLTVGASSTATIALADIAGYYDGSSNAVTGIGFSFNTGTISTGVIKVWGMT